MRLCALAAAVVCTALLAAGCGGGGSASSNSTTPPEGGGAPKKATSPNAPAGSKVVACKVGAVEMEQLRATAVDCGSARETMRRWGRSHACTFGKGSSRSSCSLGGFRCQAVRSDEGAAVSCARPGGDLSFVAKAWMLRGSGG
ncbi:MAG TPA: hypothetical protein VGI17_12490 [Solirubrobacterales bacterium]|jgi:hypothetical protein